VPSEIKPLFLLADSQLLFWQREGIPFLSIARDQIPQTSPKAAYLGASNEDDPAFYQLFEAAMDLIEIHDRRMIPSRVTNEDISFLSEADLILLAGGDAVRGWKTFEESGMREHIVNQFLNGAILIGISAGAMQLGQYVWPEGFPDNELILKSFGLAPFVIGAHDEKNDWADLKQALAAIKTEFPAIGIPSGGGLIYHADGSVEPVRKPLHELLLKDGTIKSNILDPP